MADTRLMIVAQAGEQFAVLVPNQQERMVKQVIKGMQPGAISVGTEPPALTARGVYFQVGLGDDGEDWTLWIEDGL